MREEDRKKLAYERDENKQKLDNCRAAMNVESAAKLLRQQADSEVQLKKQTTMMKEESQVLKRELEQRVHAAEVSRKSMQDQMEKQETTHRIMAGRLASEIETLKEVFPLQNNKFVVFCPILLVICFALKLHLHACIALGL